VVTAVLVVSFGRLGDMFGRVRMFNLGFAIFAAFSVLLSLTWLHGSAAAWWLIGMRILQAVGGAMLMANSSAILTDAFPAHERGLALGLNQVAGIAGSFIGLVLGGVLGPISWRYVFAAGVDHVRRAARLQPDRHPARARHQQTGREPRRLPHRSYLLPDADLGVVRPRPGHRVRLRDRGLPGRGRGLAAAGPQVRA
jgi:predicted MFS family arabinose efflux permease